jgi:hypothetical protein
MAPVDSGVVGRFGGHDAVDNAGTETFQDAWRCSWPPIGQHAGNAAADAGQNADSQANDGRRKSIPFLLRKLPLD